MRHFTEITPDQLRQLCTEHQGEPDSTLGDVSCNGWYPLVTESGELTGEIAEAGEDYELTENELAMVYV